MNSIVLVYITSTETIEDFVLLLHLLLPSLMWSVNIIKVQIVFILFFLFLFLTRHINLLVPKGGDKRN